MPGSQSIQGLASNLDINSIVDAIIKSERTPVVYLENDKTLKTQQVAAYQAVLAKFLALKSSSVLLMKEASFDKSTVEVSDDTVLSAVAEGQIGSGAYSLRVLSLAGNHQVASQGFDSASATDMGTGTIRISVGNAGLTTLNIDAGKNSLLGIKGAINNAHIGVTASIINDGSSSKPYRLLLTADATGAAQKINFESSLTGGETIDLVGRSFDNPEELSFSAGSTSNVSLGATALYNGTKNKNYTFTVAGTGIQTIGSNNVTINWTDGTNSGSILVTQSDTEYELNGPGADGLKLTFSAGTLTAGDTFQVGTFAPLLQAASDARVAIGADGTGEGSAITINSATNRFDDLIPGLQLTVKKVSDPGTLVTIKTDIDVPAIKQMLTDFIDRYNDAMKFIDDQFTYNKDTKESGVLFSDFSLQVMQSTLRSATTSPISDIQDQIKMLAALGIRSNASGRLSLSNSAKLTDAIKNDFTAFKNLFIDSGSSSSPYIEFLSAGAKTAAGKDYDVNITQAATKAYYQGAVIADPAVTPITFNAGNNIIKLKIDGVVSNDIALSARVYQSGADLAGEIQSKISADSKIGTRGVSVEWVDLGSTGYLKFTGGSYGSSSRVEMVTSITNGAYGILGLLAGTGQTGVDVAGTINGEAATGAGQILSGKEGNRTTEGLKLKVTLSGRELINGAEGTISIIRGLGSRIDKNLDNITKSIDGSVARRTTALNNQIENLTKQISDYDKRLEARREDLLQQFNAMEEALSRYQSEGSFLTTQLASLSSNLQQSTSG
ncbi:MAG: flagellar filament capping protein FliD [candidate division Zixibacteria bacterium]|nr:flagellar filament capping protein FliD [candidate division Zixibacteria bacterium]